MENSNNQYGSTGQSGVSGSAGQGSGDHASSRPLGGGAAPGTPGASTFSGNRDRGGSRLSAEPSASVQPEQLYSFRALVAVGLLGFTVGRLFSR
ncbi:hypothetical protein [Ancylobacter sp.]|uniref:hypothetical protein n=1 Tax=Ancylobacter sp. TaxID=1872567 RepID=UPI003D0DE919